MSIGASYCLRPYNVESTSSHLITEVKPQVSTWMGDLVSISGVADIIFSQPNINIFTYHQESLVSIGAIYCL